MLELLVGLLVLDELEDGEKRRKIKDYSFTKVPTHSALSELAILYYNMPLKMRVKVMPWIVMDGNSYLDFSRRPDGVEQRIRLYTEDKEFMALHDEVFPIEKDDNYTITIRSFDWYSERSFAFEDVNALARTLLEKLEQKQKHKKKK